MRVLWHSNAPWACTGYGQQTDIVTRQMRRDGHDVAISCMWGLGGNMLEREDMRLYPADEDWGNKYLVAYATHWGHGNPQNVQTVTLMDVWVLQNPLFSTLNMASWVPVDHDPIPPRVKEFFDKTGSFPIAMSRFGERKLQEAGLECGYVPHVVDRSIFKPVDQKIARELIGAVPEDAFVVGMVAKNSGNALPRKCFPEVFEAFAAFSKRHDDAYLYLHTAMRAVGSGLDLAALANVMGIDKDRIRFTPEIVMSIGMEPEKMPVVHSQFDVLINPSLGEGFGIPIVEAQACGVPVIVNDHSAMPELVGDGVAVSGKRLYDPAQGAWFQTPNVGELVEALEDAYQNKRGGGSEKAVEFARQYDADSVYATGWRVQLADLEKKMAERYEEPDVKLNRAERRRRKKAAA